MYSMHTFSQQPEGQLNKVLPRRQRNMFPLQGQIKTKLGLMLQQWRRVD